MIDQTTNSLAILALWRQWYCICNFIGVDTSYDKLITLTQLGIMKICKTLIQRVSTRQQFSTRPKPQSTGCIGDTTSSFVKWTGYLCTVSLNFREKKSLSDLYKKLSPYHELWQLYFSFLCISWPWLIAYIEFNFAEDEMSYPEPESYFDSELQPQAEK